MRDINYRRAVLRLELTIGKLLEREEPFRKTQRTAGDICGERPDSKITPLPPHSAIRNPHSAFSAPFVARSPRGQLRLANRHFPRGPLQRLARMPDPSNNMAEILPVQKTVPPELRMSGRLNRSRSPRE